MRKSVILLSQITIVMIDVKYWVLVLEEVWGSPTDLMPMPTKTNNTESLSALAVLLEIWKLDAKIFPSVVESVKSQGQNLSNPQLQIVLALN